MSEQPTPRFFGQKMTNRQKNIFRAAAVIFLVVVVLASISFANLGSDEDSRSRGQVSIQLIPAIKLQARDSFRRKVEFTGRVHSKLQTLVSFQRAGLVTELLVDEGARVEQGHAMAQLDSRHLNARIDSLAAQLAEAEATLTELQAGPRSEVIEAAKARVADLTQQLSGQQLQLDRSEKLVRTKAVAKQDYEQVLYATRALQAKLDSAQSQLDELVAGTRPEKIAAQKAVVASLQANLQLAQHELDDCVLKAPFSGMIVARIIDAGAVVSAGTAVFELIDDQNLEVHVGVPTRVAGLLETGLQYDLLVEGRTAAGVVRSVLAKVDQLTRTQKIVIDVVEKRQARPVAGQIARIQFSDEIQQTGYWIPASSISSDQRGLWSCFTIKSADVFGGDSATRLARGRGTLQKQSVEVLYQEQDWVFVRGTLRDGQLLVSDGLHRVVPGQQVDFQETENTYITRSR